MQYISSIEQLDKVMSNLHDCPFDLDRMTLDTKAETWAAMFLRPLWDDPLAEYRGLSILYARTRLPVVEATLTVSGVINCGVFDDQGIGRYSFNQVEPIATGIRLRFNERLYIDLALAGPIAATYDEQPLPNLCAIYRQYFLVQSGPSIESVAV